ncbi:MAG: hypothetical protein UHX00_01235 [Caryophanon sp.]|nr:hypothetical protein [Caryophanon sp.]
MNENKQTNLSLSPDDFFALSPEKQARFLDLAKEIANSALERMKQELEENDHEYKSEDVQQIQNDYDKLLQSIKNEYEQEINYLHQNGFEETVSELAAKKDIDLSELKDLVNDMGEAEFYENIRVELFPQNRRSLHIQTSFLDSIMPKTFYIPNSKVANSLTNPQVTFDVGTFEVELNKQRDISVQVTLNFDDENIQIIEKNGRRLTAFDRSVLNSVCSRFEAGNLTFTPDQIYRTMNGLTEREFVSAESKARIIESIDKMRMLEVKIDYTEEATKMYKKPHTDRLNKYVISSYLLALSKVELITSNGAVQGYKLLEKPIIYTYSQHNNQIISVPITLLNTKNYLRTTPDVTVIREYLIRRIAVMKNDKTKSNKILFEKVYDELSLIDPDKKKTKKIRDIVEKVLTKFKDDSFIEDFELFKKGRSFCGVSIKNRTNV